MFCNVCGAEINDQAVVCPKCGVPTVKNFHQGAKESAPHSVSALVCSIFGLIIPILGLVLSIIGLCLSASGQKQAKKHPELYDSTAMSVVAMILSILGLVGWVGYIIFVACVGAELFELFYLYEDLFY